MSGAIAILVKTPGRSALKTRLAATHGEAYARQWHALAAQAVAAVAREAARASGAAVYWAVAEPEALSDPCWSDLPTIAQGDGGLGERMHRVHARLIAAHGAAILLGADTPQIDAQALHGALRWLAHALPRLVMAPTRDGGFWLFGGNRAISVQRWLEVPYSQPHTAARFRAALDGCGQWHDLPPHTDVDTASDLDVCAAALLELAEPQAAQRTLLDWMAAQTQRRVGSA